MKFSFETQQPKKEVDNKPFLESESENDSDSLLKQRVVEVNLGQLKSSDFMVIRDCMAIIDSILNSGYEKSIKFGEEKEKFLEAISQGYSEMQLENCALYHILVGSEIDSSVEHLDLEGEYSIRDFIRGFAKDNL